MSSTGHPLEGVLEQYAMGRLNGPAVESLEEHILVCESCQDRLDFTETYIRGMKSAMESAERKTAESRWRSRFGDWFAMPPVWAGVGAAAAILAIAGIFGSQYFARSGAPVALALTANRGETASVPAKGPLDLTLDARDLPSGPNNRVQIVNANGLAMWETQAAVIQGGSVQVRVDKRLERGQYFVRLFAAGPSTPREYALQLR